MLMMVTVQQVYVARPVSSSPGLRVCEDERRLYVVFAGTGQEMLLGLARILLAGHYVFGRTR